MRKIYLSLFIILPCVMRAQAPVGHMCEDCNHLVMSMQFSGIYMDTSRYYMVPDTSYANNLWQIGYPAKNYFNSSILFGQGAMVTDTINPYPVNNISVFEVAFANCSPFTAAWNCGGYWGPWISINGYIDSDSLHDGGTILVSHSGSPWRNILDDTLPYSVMGDFYTVNDTVSALHQPGFSGHRMLSTEFFYNPEYVNAFDTIRLRFVFASDSIPESKDGWMISYMQIDGIFEGIEEFIKDGLIDVYPVPANAQLNISRKTKSGAAGEVTIYDMTGKIIYSEKIFDDKPIDVSKWPNGNYLVKYVEGKKGTGRTITVLHQ